MNSDDIKNGIFIFSLEVNSDPAEIEKSADAFVLIGQVNKNPLTYAVGGYDDDPRELWDVPEVLHYLREWCACVKKKGGHGLDRLDDTGKALLLYACGKADIERVEGGGVNFLCHGRL
jgi:hypothetical protein